MAEIEIKQHYVTFFSPGTFMAESTTQPIDQWDIDEALRRLEGVVERYGATPYGFQFTTRGRAAGELDSRELHRSGIYFYNVNVRTRDEVNAENNPKEEVLRANMRVNDIEKVVTTRTGWRWTQPVQYGDTILHPADMERALKKRPTLPAKGEG